MILTLIGGVAKRHTLASPREPRLTWAIGPITITRRGASRLPTGGQVPAD
jgi:hypothetical protein